MGTYDQEPPPSFARTNLGLELPCEYTLVRELNLSPGVPHLVDWFDGVLFGEMGEAGYEDEGLSGHSFLERRAEQLRFERRAAIADVLFAIETTATRKITEFHLGYSASSLPQDCNFLLADGVQVQLFARGARRPLHLLGSQGGPIIGMEYREDSTELLFVRRYANHEALRTAHPSDREWLPLDAERWQGVEMGLKHLAQRVESEKVWGYEPETVVF